MIEIKERISISKFAEGYKKLTSEQLKDRYIKEHIKTTYAPILQKKLILEMMNSKAVVEAPVKYIDMTVSKLNVVMAILVLYTDIEPDKKENEDGTTAPLTWEAYDILKSTGLYEKLLNAIGEDLNELMSVLSISGTGNGASVPASSDTRNVKSAANLLSGELSCDLAVFSTCTGCFLFIIACCMALSISCIGAS